MNQIATAASRAEANLFGQPRGLVFLALTETWERFSFYGMQTLLLFYMVDDLLVGHSPVRVLGLDWLRSAMQSTLGPMTNQAFASEIFGLYSGLTWFTPLFGGYVGDRLLGRRRTVVLGALLMSAGHLLMASDRAFLLALMLLIAGCGCLKGNITAQVGALYETGDPRRSRGFALFNVGVNIGGLLGPFVCGGVGELFGWHVGFAVAGILMLVGLATYLAGQRWMPPDVLLARDGASPPALSRQDRQVLTALLLVLLIGMFFSIAYYQLGDIYLLWVRSAVDRRFLSLIVPATWFGAIDSLFTIASTPVLIMFWRYQSRRGRESSDLAKIGIASAIVALAYAILAALSLSHKPLGMIWPVLFSAMLGTAFVYQWPITLALVSRAAAPSIRSTMMGVAFLTIFVSYMIVGRLGAIYETVSHAQFWLLHAAIAATGAILVVILHRPLSRTLAAAD